MIGHRYALVRHPRVRGGTGRCYGRLDLPLADPGRDIPPLIAALVELRGAQIHTSPLARCRLVAEALAGDWGALPPLVDARLMEMDFGAWEGQAWDDVPRAALDAWAADLMGFSPPGGESGADLILRVSAAWDQMTAEGRDLVVITHGGPLKVLAAFASGQPVDLSVPAPPMGQVIYGYGGNR
jgi:alpha-ribazole phosphatase